MIPAEKLVLWPRLRAAAVAAIFILAVITGISIESTRPSYVESATVLFRLPTSMASASGYSEFGRSLIATGQVISQIVMSPQSRILVKAAGESASYSMALNNSYNQDYPDFNYPEATLIVSSPDPATTGSAFAVATRLVGEILAARQERAGVPTADRIAARIIGNSGPTASTGSRKRALAGLAVLTMIAVAWVRSFFSRSALAARKH